MQNHGYGLKKRWYIIIWMDDTRLKCCEKAFIFRNIHMYPSHFFVISNLNFRNADVYFLHLITKSKLNIFFCGQYLPHNRNRECEFIRAYISIEQDFPCEADAELQIKIWLIEFNSWLLDYFWPVLASFEHQIQQDPWHATNLTVA